MQWSRALSLMCEVAQLHIGHRFELVPLIPGGHLLPFSTEFHGKTKHGHGPLGILTCNLKMGTTPDDTCRL